MDRNSGNMYRHSRRRIMAAALLCVCMLFAGCADTTKEHTAADGQTVQREADAVQQKEKSEPADGQKEPETASQEEAGNSTQQTAVGTESGSESGMRAQTQNTPQRIICWGDSLTYGQGGDGVTYPDVIQQKTGLPVINYGIQGETARQIAIRMGALQMSTGAFTIPADTAPVQVLLWQGGDDPIMMRMDDAGINPCTIAGVEGTLSYNEGDGAYYFTRTQAGDPVMVPNGMPVQTFAEADRRDDDIIILFAGSNLPPDKDTAGELVSMEKQMLSYLGTDRYLVLGLTCKTLINDVAEINTTLEQAFGDHFVDIRAYLLENGLEKAGITPTEQDKKELEWGEIPSSLRVDQIHGNYLFYQIVGEYVAEQLEQKGYLR